MTTITPDLRAKIERRAKRAWRRKRDGATKSVSRISDVTKNELNYRLPYTPDYYGSEKVRVIRHDDGTIEVDPKTTGLIDCKKKDDLERLKKHGDIVKAYVTVRQNGDVPHSGQKLKLGKDYKAKTVKFKSREQCIEEANPGDRVLVIELHADNIDAHNYGTFDVKIFSVTDELDQEKDLGFTVGLIDCQSKADLAKLKKHIGKVRAYVLKKRSKKKLPLNKKHTLKTGERYTSFDDVSDRVRSGDRAYAAEFDYTDIDKHHTDGVTAAGKIVEELDPQKDLGFTVGTMLDLVKSSDLKKLNKHDGMVRAYKYVTKDLKSPTRTGPEQITYKVGEEFEVKDANTNDDEACAAGINVASQEWCNQGGAGSRYLAFEFHSKDIAAVPTDGGKLRVFRCLCVEEVDDKFNPLKPRSSPAAPPQAPTTPDDDPPKGFLGKLFGG